MTQEDINQIKDIIRKELETLNKTDRYTFEKDIQILNGRSIQLGKGKGTMIGTEGYGDASATDAGQKLGFYGTTPVAQQAAITPPSGGTTVDTQCRSAVATIIIYLQNLGLIA